jgi:hypothetical protein
MTASVTNKFAAVLLAFGMLLAGFSAMTSFTSVPTHAQYGEYVSCQDITNPERRQKCNDRVQKIVDKRIEQIQKHTAKRIEQILKSKEINKNALILSALNVQYWEIWNILNVIFPLVS